MMKIILIMMTSMKIDAVHEEMRSLGEIRVNRENEKKIEKYDSPIKKKITPPKK